MSVVRIFLYQRSAPADLPNLRIADAPLEGAFYGMEGVLELARLEL